MQIIPALINGDGKRWTIQNQRFTDQRTDQQINDNDQTSKVKHCIFLLYSRKCLTNFFSLIKKTFKKSFDHGESIHLCSCLRLSRGKYVRPSEFMKLSLYILVLLFLFNISLLSHFPLPWIPICLTNWYLWDHKYLVLQIWFSTYL